MAVRVVNLKCSGCGSPLDPSMLRCEFCGNAVVITTFNSIIDRTTQELNKLAGDLERDMQTDLSCDMRNMAKFTQACCYLKLRLYDKAIQKFELAIEDNFDNSETYFYAAVCLLKGKKAFLVSLATIKKVIEYLDAALSIECRGIFYYMKAYIKYDFYKRKCLQIQPDYFAELQLAFRNNLSVADAEKLFKVLCVECPTPLRF